MIQLSVTYRSAILIITLLAYLINNVHVPEMRYLLILVRLACTLAFC